MGMFAFPTISSQTAEDLMDFAAVESHSKRITMRGFTCN